MLVTALTPHIGYDKAAELAHWAYENDTSLLTANQHFGYLTEEVCKDVLDAAQMLGCKNKTDAR